MRGGAPDMQCMQLCAQALGTNIDWCCSCCYTRGPWPGPLATLTIPCDPSILPNTLRTCVPPSRTGCHLSAEHCGITPRLELPASRPVADTMRLELRPKPSMVGEEIPL